MKTFEVDLYEYFNVKKPANGVGTLDCFVPDNSTHISPSRMRPSVLVIPGGAYTHTSFREGEPVALKYTAKGFCAFVLNYSVLPVKYPYCLAEAIMAMNYIRLNAKELYLDENMVTAIGFSAGGHLAGMLGSYWESKEAEKIFKSKVLSRPNAVILCYAQASIKEDLDKICFTNLCGEGKDELYEKLSLENLINEKSSPAFIWATHEDMRVSVKNSLIIADAYAAAGVPFSLHIYGKGRHGLSVADDTVYGEIHGEIIKTASLPGWVDLSVEWLKEQGIELKG